MDKSRSDDSQSTSGSDVGSIGSGNTRPRRLGRGRARCLPSDSQDQVRRPGAETLNGLTAQNSVESPSSAEAPSQQQPAAVEGEVARMSSLRVNAVEFVPRTFSMPPPAQASPVHQNLKDPPQHQPQQQLASSSSANRAPPSSSSSSSSKAEPPRMPRPRRISSNSYHFNENVAIDYLEETLQKLVMNPGSFVELVTPLVEVLNGWIEDNETLSLIVDVIFHQAVSESNFHWTGAKLCGHLAQHLTVNHDGNFRQHLLKRCHEEHRLRDNFLRTMEGKKRLHGFAFFLAELFISMEVASPNGGTQRIHVLRKALFELIQTLMKDPIEENYKTIVKVLKLSGAVLEDCERSERGDGMAQDMDLMITVLKGCARQHSWSKSCRDMMNSVVELRANNWGRAESVPTTTTADLANGGYGVSMVPNAYVVNGALVQAGPVFYAANGVQISAQEAGYMSESDYIQQLHWGNEATGDSNYQNYRGGGGNRGATAEENTGNGFAGSNAVTGHNQGQGDYGVPHDGFDAYDGLDPYESGNIAASNEMWSANDEMTEDMIEAFNQFIMENNMDAPALGPNGYGNDM